MPQICETPADEAGASRDFLGRWSRNLHTSDAEQVATCSEPPPIIATHWLRSGLLDGADTTRIGGGAGI